MSMTEAIGRMQGIQSMIAELTRPTSLGGQRRRAEIGGRNLARHRDGQR